ncbi:hypothetical protein [Emcibacter sp. SYSU 3D8]|uniref:hypothetical protein n=1 Tax=Emcibacter sp. SYSU 3D8 TaxID=3133969 RepID=UPI0031FEBD75
MSSFRGPWAPSLALFLAGALLRVDIYAIGRISFGELILVLLSVGYWGKLLDEARHVRAIGIYLVLLGLWVLGIVLSDLVNGSGFDLFFRGVARPLVVLSMFVACFGLLRKHPRAFLWFFLGLLVSASGNLIFETDFRVSDHLEKLSYGYAAFVYTPMVFAVTTIAAFFLARYNAALPTLLFVAVFLLVSERFSRTTAASFLAAAAIFHLVLLLRSAVGTRRFGPGSVMMMVFIALIGGYLALQAYIGLAVSGAFGDRLAGKVLMQIRAPTSDDVINMFLSARYALVSNYLMIVENPIFGSGSWPVEGPYVIKALRFLGIEIPPVVYLDIVARRGTGHSILFGNWANYGPLVIPFWIYIFSRTLAFFKDLVLSRSRLYWLVAPYLITFLFSIPFNNLSSLNRIFAALIPAAMIVATVAVRDARQNGSAVADRGRTARPLPGSGIINA